MRGGEKEENNQRWLMSYGEGKKRGEEIEMMIIVSETALMMTMRQGGGHSLSYGGTSRRRIPLASFSLRALPPKLLMLWLKR